MGMAGGAVVFCPPYAKPGDDTLDCGSGVLVPPPEAGW